MSPFFMSFSCEVASVLDTGSTRNLTRSSKVDIHVLDAVSHGTLCDIRNVNFVNPLLGIMSASKKATSEGLKTIYSAIIGA